MVIMCNGFEWGHFTGTERMSAASHPESIISYTQEAHLPIRTSSGNIIWVLHVLIHCSNMPHTFYTVVTVKSAFANTQTWHHVKIGIRNIHWHSPKSYQANNGKNTTKPIKCSRQRTTCRDEYKHEYTPTSRRDNCTMPGGTGWSGCHYDKLDGLVTEFIQRCDWFHEWEVFFTMLYLGTASCRQAAQARRP